eukprot:6194707-Pleurochrysis_carterae.AAC.1
MRSGAGDSGGAGRLPRGAQRHLCAGNLMIYPVLITNSSVQIIVHPRWRGIGDSKRGKFWRDEVRPGRYPGSGPLS